MILKFTVTAFALIAGFSAQPVRAEDVSEKIVGMWKLTSFIRKELATGKESNFYGEQPSGYIVYSRGGHFLTFAPFLAVGS